jgi:SAM-dependent methyltransferase
MKKHPAVTKHIINSEVFWKYRNTYYPDRLTQKNAMEFIKDTALKYCKGKGLDIGAGKYPLPGAIPIREGIRENAYNLSHYEDNSLDYIFSSHCMEHLRYPWQAMGIWLSKLKVNGIIFLYLPHIDMELWRPGAPWVGDQHKWSPTFSILSEQFSKRDIEIIAGSDLKDDLWSWHIVGRKNGI